MKTTKSKAQLNKGEMNEIAFWMREFGKTQRYH